MSKLLNTHDGVFEKVISQNIYQDKITKPRRLIPLLRFNDFYPDPSVKALRWLRFTNQNNFNEECVVLRGRRVLICEESYFNWIAKYNLCNRSKQ